MLDNIFINKQLDYYEGMGVFHYLQLAKIKEGFEQGLTIEQVAIYALPEMDWLKMDMILRGILDHVDVSWYADWHYEHEQMLYIYYGLLNNLNVSLYANTKYTAKQMHELYSGLLMGLDISKFADAAYSAEQMKLIRWGILNGFDVNSYANPAIPVEEMRIRYEKFMTHKT